MKPQIRLYRLNGVWMSDNSKADNAATIRQLFGTYHLPTACTDKADAQTVREQIARLNQGHVIVIG